MIDIWLVRLLNLIGYVKSHLYKTKPIAFVIRTVMPDDD